MYKKLGFIFAFLAVIGLVLFLVGGLYKYDGHSYGALNNALGAVEFGKLVDEVQFLGPNVEVSDLVFQNYGNLVENLKYLFTNIKQIYQPLITYYELFLTGVVIFPIWTFVTLICFYYKKIKKEDDDNKLKWSNGESLSEKERKVLELQKQMEEINKKN